MTKMMEVMRSGVQAWECDRMGHWNVRFYFKQAGEGMGLFSAALGLPPQLLTERRQGWIARGQHVRFLRELRPGVPYRVMVGVLEASAERLRVYNEIQHVALDEPAATVISELYLGDLDSRLPLPVPDDVLHACEAYRCEVPPYAEPRGLSSDPPGPAPTRQDSAARGMTPAFLGPARAEFCDAAGYFTPTGHMACVSDGIDHFFHGTDQRGRKGVGGAALEYRFAFHRPVRCGDAIEVLSALKGLGPKTKHLCHHLFDAVSGVCVATSEAIVVVFDLEARRAMALGDDERQRLSANVVPGIGI